MPAVAAGHGPRYRQIMTAESMGIEIHDLLRSYNGRPAVDIPLLEIPPRHRLALLGPSGCGKSTLIRLVLGLIAPDRGRISVGGTPLAAETCRVLRLRIGYVVQEGALFPHLTARENVAVVARDLVWSAERVAARLEELAALAGLDAGELARYPAELSGGQRQRVGLMRALMLDPAVLLLDEPLGALDPVTRARLQRELREIFERLQKTVVVVTHDVAEAAYLGEDIALMRAGRIVQRGPLRALLASPADPEIAEFLNAQRPVV